MGTSRLRARNRRRYNTNQSRLEIVFFDLGDRGFDTVTDGDKALNENAQTIRQPAETFILVRGVDDVDFNQLTLLKQLCQPFPKGNELH